MLEVGLFVVVAVVAAAVAVVFSFPITPIGASLAVVVSTVVVLTVVVSTVVVLTVVVLTGATTTVVDVVVTAAGVVDVGAAGAVVSGTDGGMVLRVKVAPHSSLEVPLGQHLTSVQ